MTFASLFFGCFLSHLLYIKFHRNKIVNEYFKGEHVVNLCKRYRVKKSALYSWILVKKKVIRKSNFESTLENKINVVTIALSGKSVIHICKKFQLKRSTLYYWISKYRSSIENNTVIVRKKKIEKVSRMKQSIIILKRMSVSENMCLMEKVELVKSLSSKHSLKLLCELFKLSRSTYYSYQNKKIPTYLERDKMLKVMIKETYLRHKKRIGAIKIKHDLLLQGQLVSLKKVFQIMQGLQIRMITLKKKPFIVLHKKTNENLKNLLNQQFEQKAPNIVWVSDITEIKIKQKPVYLCVIIDLFSRKVVAHQVSRKNNTRLTMMTIDQAIKKRKLKPNMFHSDRGVQYTSFLFQEHLQKKDISQSYSAPGYPYDNSVMESFFSSFKRETVKKMIPFTIIQEYIKMVNEYITYYNHVRFHRGIGMLTPVDKEKIYYSLN